MIIEVRSPKEGELWWRRNSQQWIDGSVYDGLYLYKRVGLYPPAMCRCYGAVKDLRSIIISGQFASVSSGSPVKVEPYQLVNGDWYLAAEQNNVAEFLRGQVEEYRQVMLRMIDDEVDEMIAIIENGKNPDDVPQPWIERKVKS